MHSHQTDTSKAEYGTKSDGFDNRTEHPTKVNNIIMMEIFATRRVPKLY